MKKKKTGLGIMIYLTLLIMLVVMLTLGFAELITYILNKLFHRALNLSSTGWLMIFSIILGMVFARLASSLVLSPITRLG